MRQGEEYFNKPSVSAGAGSLASGCISADVSALFGSSSFKGASLLFEVESSSYNKDRIMIYPREL